MDSGQLTIQQTLQQAASRLSKAGIDTARLDAEVLLRHVLGIDRTQLFLRYPDPIAAIDQDEFERLISQRLDGVPVAYLTATREFMGLPFLVGPDILIPRPDTEPLVEWALNWLNTQSDASIVDVGTGSGAIAISLAAHLPPSFTGKIIATDSSFDALAITRRNAETLLPADRFHRMSFIQGSLTAPLAGPIDLLLANLPYLTPEQIAGNADLEAEPRMALDGGTDGLTFIRDVIADLPRLLSPTGAAGFEVDPSQAAQVSALLSETLSRAQTRVVQDLARLSRHVIVTRE